MSAVARFSPGWVHVSVDGEQGAQYPCQTKAGAVEQIVAHGWSVDGQWQADGYGWELLPITASVGHTPTLPDDIVTAMVARADTWPALRAAREAADAASLRLAAMVTRVLYGDTAHVLTFDVDGDTDGTWLVPGECFTEAGEQLDYTTGDGEVTIEQDDLVDALTSAVRDLQDDGGYTVTLPDGGTAAGIVLADYLAAPEPPADPIVCRRCQRVVHLLQGHQATAWYHVDDETLVCGGRVWRRVPTASIGRLWAPVVRASET